MPPSYKAHVTEQKWQKKWAVSKLYKVNLAGKKPKYYNLVMFPYPSGDKLHVGHWYNYGPADSWGRYIRMRGYNVFEPMGFDSFGLPAENYAIKTGVAPQKSTEKNIKYMIKQLGGIGTMYDWEKTVVTSRPDYYKWSQWVFLQLYKKNLAYKKKAPVNWCPSCKTVLANEQVQDGNCERCGTEVTKKDLTQWFFDIRKYAEALLCHDKLEWPEKTLLMQENWIGRSQGIDISYKVESLDSKITVYTTRPDTNFGATFVVVAPESAFVKENFSAFKNKEEIKAYIKAANKKSDIERIAEGRKKTGVSTGLYAINHLTGKKMPIFVSDFVLAHVGTGCVVGVPGHDLRDFEFAKEKKLEIIRVVVGVDGDTSPITKAEQVQEERGKMINSDFLNEMDIHVAKEKIMDHLEKKNRGKRVVNYKLRDWLISRQRYWGAPIPIVICAKCGEVPVPEKDLPVVLPIKNVDYKPKGKAPLASVASFVKTKCPKCKGKATREVDTMDTFVCSSWYFLRYLSAKDKKQAFDMNLIKKWLPVDMYIGGPEHACMHLLYARFIHKVLMNDPKAEPFKRLVHQGLITKNGAKMSKSKGNVVSPDEFVAKYGSDVFRMYLMFMGPFTDGGDWSDKGITGIARFVERFYTMVSNKEEKVADKAALAKMLNKLIKKVSEDIEKFHFNTAVAALMEFTNFGLKNGLDKVSKKIAAQLIAPLAPHLAEECWKMLGSKNSIFDAGWPKFDPKLVVDDTVKIGVQVNGKVRGEIEINKNATQEEAIKLARINENVLRYLTQGQLIKEIYVPGRIVGFVVK
ncbi:leucine--tRNA ligase [Candidatus Peregrinibacteria bacterium]|nr:leucine--tRNA ligase [Candidatus Peregrinibacteria bacterium]